MNDNTQRFTFVDLFAGAGGLSTGLAQHGEPIGAVEWNADAAASYRLTHPAVKLAECDINEADLSEWKGVDVVAGGPPCQPWSIGGYRRGPNDARDGLPAFTAALVELRPRAFLMENVPGLLAPDWMPCLRGFCGRMERVGYHVDVHLLQVADFGVPQLRQRVVVLGGLAGPIVPPPTLCGPGRVTPWVPAGRWIGHEPYGESTPAIVTYAARPDVRPSPYAGLLVNGGGRPIDLDRPAPTILASMGGNKTPWVDTAGIVPAYHAHLRAGGEPRSGPVEGARRLSVDEAALLQTFFPGTRFVGTRASQWRQVGNAVPPLLALALGRALAAHLWPGPIVNSDSVNVDEVVA